MTAAAQLDAFAGPFPVADLRRAIENRDAEAQIALYHPDAVITVTDPNHTPAAPKVLRGTSAIAGWVVYLCRLDMTHHLQDFVLGGDKLAFTEHGRQRDGTLVTSMSTLAVRDGLITRQNVVVVWDGWD